MHLIPSLYFAKAKQEHWICFWLCVSSTFPVHEVYENVIVAQNELGSVI